jgi:RING finger protein 113A
MFKKREKSANALKRTLEDRYQDESQAKDEEHESKDQPAKR